MSNNYFAFKQFTIHHDKCAMKVGTDGVLLGAWAPSGNATKILDVGTGCGLIAIMMAQRTEAYVDAVEIDEQACIQAAENIRNCPWKNRIHIHHDSFRQFAGYTTTRYDIIISNPPYFRNSLKPPGDARSVARHDANLNYEGLISGSKELLTQEGRLVMIIPAGETDHVTTLSHFYQLYPRRILWVRPFPGKDFSRCLMELTGTRYPSCDESELIIKNRDLKTYTADYVELTKEFYLEG